MGDELAAARAALESFVRQMVDDDGALAIKEVNGRGLSLYIDRLIDAARRSPEEGK